MPESVPHFVWCELMTSDAKSATEFYRSVVGWRTHDAGMGWAYEILNAGDTAVGGVMAFPPGAMDAGAKPGWMGYVGVPDVEAYAGRVTKAGGAVHRPPDDIPGVGRFAVVADPQGAVFTLFKPSGPGEEPPAAGSTPGRVGWHELHAADRETAVAFYADLFGWTKADAIDMGPIGTYQLFASGGPPIGGMMTKTDAVPAPVWVYYFNVDRIDAAVTRLTQAGGQLLQGPHQVPGGSWIAHARDPQGAMFALTAPDR